MNEKQILKYIRINQRLGQKVLFEKFSDKMFLLCNRYVSSKEDAEEVVMQGFCKVFENINRFNYQGKGSLEAWMKKIMVNESLMFLRSKRKFEITNEYDFSENLPVIDYHDIDSEYLYKLILKLPLGYRTVFNLFIIEGLSHKEIAEKLNIDVNTSKSQLSKARKLLIKYLSKVEERYETA